MRVLKCVICAKPLTDRKPGEPPFCSERCRLIDLGKWAGGEYAVPGESVPLLDDDAGPTGYGDDGDGDGTLH